jgi:Mg-chelatase subunit ChlD
LKSFSVLVQPSKRASNRIGVAETGLDPGTYRFAISAANSHLNAEIEIERTGATPKLAKTENKTAATKEPEKPAVAGSSEQKPEPRFGYNIALGALGGRVERASQYGKDDGGWSKRHINDGLTWVRAPHDLNKCMICGWGSRDGDRRPSIVLSFHKNREAELAAVVVDTRYFRDPRNNYDQHTAWLPKDVAVHVSSVSPTSGFERVAIKRIYRNVDRQVIRLPRGTRAKFVKVEVLENYGAPAVVVGEIEVIEADSHETSILDDAEIDLANVALGGALVRFTSQVKDQLAAAYLFDGEDRGRKWISYDRYFPQDFTIAFKDDHLAFIDKVRLTLPREDKVSNVPSEVAIAVSRQNPLDGFIEIGRFPVERRAGPQDFPVGQEARFVKVRLLDNHGTQRTALAEIAVIEGRREGYTSVLLRDAPTSSTDAVERDEGERVAEDAVEEVEPNNDQGTAGELIMDQMVSGAIDPLGEVDFFALPEFGAEATAFTLRYSGRPYIRHGLSLLDSGGAKIRHFNPGDLPARDARLTFALSGNEQYLKLSEPPASVVVIWDTSGSMQGSEADLERAVREYIRRAPENQGISLIRFSGDVEVLIHGFNSNKSRLQSSLNGKFWANGGTRLYDAVIKGMELLANEQGNRAIVVMTDGEDTGHTWHDHFWQKVEKNRIRLYTIGLGTGLKNYSYKIGTSGERVLRHLALATSGEAFFAAESQALQRFYARIADELSRPATYLLTPTVERGTGTLRLVATGDQVPSAAMPAVHLIYDLSGSMLERGPDGRPKYRTAQEAVFTAVDALPDGTLFGLTVYGARIPEKAGKQRACTDIVTLENLAPLNKKAVKDFIARHRPRGGTTPLAASIRHVAENFPNQNNGLIIAVTDGIEECDPSPVETVKGLKAGKMQYLELNVVGFALKDPEAQAMMKAISEVGGGQYFDASDGEALAQALKETMAAKYTVRDAADRVVGSGTIDGGDLSIPPGFYRVRIDAAGAPIQVREVRIDRDHVTTVRVNKVASDIDIVVSEPESLAAIREARQTCGAAAAELEDDRRAARIQAKLNKLRFDAGPADNRPGPRTRRAIAAFAKKYGLPEAMQVGLELEQHLDCVIAIGDTYLAAN